MASADVHSLPIRPMMALIVCACFQSLFVSFVLTYSTGHPCSHRCACDCPLVQCEQTRAHAHTPQLTTQMFNWLATQKTLFYNKKIQIICLISKRWPIRKYSLCVTQKRNISKVTFFSLSHLITSIGFLYYQWFYVMGICWSFFSKCLIYIWFKTIFSL